MNQRCPRCGLRFKHVHRHMEYAHGVGRDNRPLLGTKPEALILEKHERAVERKHNAEIKANVQKGGAVLNALAAFGRRVKKFVTRGTRGH